MKRLIIGIIPFLILSTYLQTRLFAESYTPDSVIAYWRFEDGTTNNTLPQPSTAYDFTAVVYDESGNGNHLSSWPGSDEAMKYDADTDHSKVPQSSQRNNNAIKNNGIKPKLFTKSTTSNPSGADIETADFSNFTIEASYKPLLNNQFRTIVGRDAQLSTTNMLASLYLQITYDNRFKILFVDHDGNAHVAQTAANYVTTSKWYHLVATNDGSKLELFLYDDDNQEYTAIASTTYSSSNSNIYIGSKIGTNLWHPGGWTVGRGLYNGIHTDYAKGLIDEVRISNAVLPQSQWLQKADTAFTDTSWINPRLPDTATNEGLAPQRSIVKLGSTYYGAKNIGPVYPNNNSRLQLLQSTDGQTWSEKIIIDFLPDNSVFHDIALWAGTLPNETNPCILIAHGTKKTTDPDNNPQTDNNQSEFTINLIRIDNLNTTPTYHHFATSIDSNATNKFLGSPFIHQLSNNTLQVYYDYELPNSNDQHIVMKTFTISSTYLTPSSFRIIAARAPNNQLSRDGMPTVTTLRKDPRNNGNDTLLLAFESINEYTFKKRINDTTHHNTIAYNNVIRGIIGYNGGQTNNDWNDNWNNDNRFIIYQPTKLDNLGRPYNAYNPHIARLGNNAGPAVVAFLTDEAINSSDWPADFSYQPVHHRRGQLQFTYSTDNFNTWSSPANIHPGNTSDGSNTSYFTTLFLQEDGKLLSTLDLFNSHRVFTFTK
ncbi:hypothetical protein KS4_06750 [Poriferisphaera corsica]|uniref:LamG-like jellyroll fold domain-containing protein n=1 Tax=Poriferisphaera corsica TaxID=2528020 RepID=A0A517YR39_9BACT|nr:LamG domain-containing protein [Poriferisphaera corsica]QDU32641.1 hypothetical protein KS4_06750 [Poriferisphaera corsica]